MNTDFFTLLQINDAAFPIGSYTLSWGLETFVQQGEIYDSETCENFLRSEIKSNFLTSELLPVRLSYEACQNLDLEELIQIDEIYNASKVAVEIREGSKKLAARFLKTVNLWMSSDMQKKTAGIFQNLKHFPVVYGSFCAFQKIREEEALSAFLYSQISSRVTTLVKLVPLSQSEGQIILHSLFEEFDEIFEEVMNLKKEDLCRSCPGSEIRSMQHEFLYTRLYMS